MSLSVAVEPTRVELEPGGTVTLTLQVGNASDVVESYVVQVLGTPLGAAVAAEPAGCTLRPGETGRLQVTISADAVHPPVAGQTVLGVVVRSPYRPEVLRCEEVVLSTRPAPGLQLAVHPEVVSGRRAAAQLDVTNQGNTVLDVELAGRDAEQAVRVAFEPPRVQLGPGTGTQVRVLPRARRPLRGMPVRRQITITAKGAGTDSTVGLVLAQRPLVPGGAMNLAAAAAGVAVLASAMIGVGVRVTNALAGRPAATAASSSPTPGPASPTTGAPATTPATPSTAASQPTSSAPGSPTGPRNTVVDLTSPPAGRQAVAQRLVPDAYPGIVLSAVPGTSSGCNGTDVSWLGLVDPAGARGVITGDLAQGSVGLCNDMTLRIGLAAPATAITVRFVATTTYAGPAAGTGTPTGTATTPTASGTATAPARPDPHHLPYVLHVDGLGGVATTTASDGDTVTLTFTDPTGKGFRSVTLAGRPSGGGVAALLTSVTLVGVG